MLRLKEVYSTVFVELPGPAEVGVAGEASSPPHFFGNFKELLRKRCFQPPHFESLVRSPTFKVVPRALATASCVAVETYPRSAVPAAGRADEACGCVGC